MKSTNKIIVSAMWSNEERLWFSITDLDAFIHAGAYADLIGYNEDNEMYSVKKAELSDFLVHFETPENARKFTGF